MMIEIIRYVAGIPSKLPKGQVLVHNFRPTYSNQPFGLNGFRTFLARFDSDKERGPRCDCGWHDGVEHYEATANQSSRPTTRKVIGPGRGIPLVWFGISGIESEQWGRRLNAPKRSKLLSGDKPKSKKPAPKKGK